MDVRLFFLGVKMLEVVKLLMFNSNYRQNSDQVTGYIQNESIHR